MQFRPGLHQPTLTLWQRAGQNRQVINGEDDLSIRRYDMEMRVVMPLAGFSKHADDETMKSCQFRHLNVQLPTFNVKL